MPLDKRVWDFSTSQGLLQDGDRVVVGVSGGSDSLCLLDVLHDLAPRHGLVLHVAHLNHGLRPEAAGEAAFVQAEAAKRGLDYFTETVDVAGDAAANKQSIETAARRLRYDFFGRVARLTGARLVAVAHTADDQAETVLMHLLRGSGLRGLRGMLPKRPLAASVFASSTLATVDPLPLTHYQLPLYLIRPLLAITRAEIMAYCAHKNLAPRTDSSNADGRYFRNRLRHELLPVLEAYNPNVRAVLARAATVAAGDYELWLETAQKLWLSTLDAAPAADGQVAFSRARWLALSVAQQRALLRMAVEQLVAGTVEIDFAPLDAAVQFSRTARPGRSCGLAAGLLLRVSVEQIIVAAERRAPDSNDRPKLVNGSLASGWHLVVEPLGATDWSLAQIATAPRWTAHVHAARLAQPIQLRARRPGDRFQPLGLGGHSMLLSEFLVNEKVPAAQRDDWPLLVCGEEIVWLVGIRLDERYKVTASTQQVTRLSIVREPVE